MRTLRKIADTLRRWLQHRHLPWHLALLAMVLCVSSLWLGWQLDDDIHRMALTQSQFPWFTRSPAELFAFIKGDEAANRQNIALGFFPWWSNEALRLSFYRPLTGLTHWVDYEVWPQLPSLMHLHSLVWFGAAVAAAAFFYRRMLSSAWIAGLAALLFAVDDAHGLPAVWIANRNALLGVFFGLLALMAHDRWRRDGSRLGAVLAPVLLLLGLLSKESTVATGAYLLAYALFLDRGKWLGRLGSLIPCAMTGVIWWVAYKELGYGVVGCGWYVDPGADPVRFAQLVAVRAPTLLAWQWLVPSDLEWALSTRAAQAMWFAAVGFLVIVAVAVSPLLKRDPLARFWALGMGLSVLPACTAYPHDRLLFFVGIGGMGLLAHFIAAVLRNGDPLSARVRWFPRRALTGTLCAILVFIHLGVAPVKLARTAGSLARCGQSIGRAGDSLPSNPASPLQTTLLVSSPSFSSYAYCALTRLLSDDPYLSRTVVLGSGGRPIEVHRQDSRTLLLRPDGGFLASFGNTKPNRDVAHVLFNQLRAWYSLDQLYRDSSPMVIGQQIKLLGISVEITAVTDDGRPAEAAFRFAFALERSLFRWLQWKDGAYVPFEPPAVGERVTLPAATIQVGSIS